MATSAVDDSQRTAAKVAGLSYLLTFVIVVFSNFAIHNRLDIGHNAAETARNILAHERLFRVAIVLDLTYCIGFVTLIAALYVILKPVNATVALLSTFWKLVYALAWMVMSLTLYDALRLEHGPDYLRAFEPDRLQALAKLYLAARFDRYYGGLLFYCLGSIASSWLWLKSRYIPRAFAAFGVISAAFCAFCTVAFLIFPTFTNLVNLWWFDTPLALFDIGLSFWLLFKGLDRT